MNNFKTFLLLFGLTVLFLAIGNWIGGQQGLVTAFMFALLMNGISYWFSDKIVLMLYGAKPVKPEDQPQLYAMVDKLAKAADLPVTPKVYIMETPAPNAFATGRDPQHAAVAVTTGIMNILGQDELEGVIAHELAHVKNRDTLIQVIAATIAGAIMMLARMAQYAAMFGGMGGRDDRDDNRGGAIGFIALAIVAPLAAMLIQMAISRSREYEADATGARICTRPLSLARALQKLHDSVRRLPAMGANPATAHLFIVNPLRGESILHLFSTHPPMAERVKRLEQLAQEMSGYKIPKFVR